MASQGDQEGNRGQVSWVQGHRNIERHGDSSTGAIHYTVLRGLAADYRNAPVNSLGYLRVMFTVDDIDDTLARLRKRGAKLVGKVVRYENTYRLCSIRGPEGIVIGLAQELGRQHSAPSQH